MTPWQRQAEPHTPHNASAAAAAVWGAPAVPHTIARMFYTRDDAMQAHSYEQVVAHDDWGPVGRAVHHMVEVMRQNLVATVLNAVLCNGA